MASVAEGKRERELHREKEKEEEEEVSQYKSFSMSVGQVFFSSAVL